MIPTSPRASQIFVPMEIRGNPEQDLHSLISKVALCAFSCLALTVLIGPEVVPVCLIVAVGYSLTRTPYVYPRLLDLGRMDYVPRIYPPRVNVMPFRSDRRWENTGRIVPPLVNQPFSSVRNDRVGERSTFAPSSQTPFSGQRDAVGARRF